MVKVKVHNRISKSESLANRDLQKLGRAIGLYFRQYVIASNQTAAPWLWLENSMTASVACAAAKEGFYPTVEFPLMNNRWVDLSIIGKHSELIFEAKHRSGNRIFRKSTPEWHDFFFNKLSRSISTAKKQAGRAKMLRLGRNPGFALRAYSGVAIYTAPYVYKQRRDIYENWYRKPKFLKANDLKELEKSFPYGMVAVEICVAPSIADNFSGKVRQQEVFWPYCLVILGLSRKSHARI